MIENASDTLEQQLDAIEQDPRLLEILAKQEQNSPLTAEEINLFNELMEKHQDISEQIALTEDEEEQSASSSTSEDLWDKLDSSDLSKYQ